jgi:UDP-3-O-[3-hydroxymyristoyl] N-acetylglucosamine deacetylase/3-hydroxyacyl-[acyl-carrier-protein] dehydratase
MSESHVVGMKNVTMNENFFVGHFPEAPVMPGSNCRSNGTNRWNFVLSTVPDPEIINLFYENR